MTAACLARAAVINEDFASDPRQRGWRSFGDTNLCRWNATNQNLEVTWDSSRPNSFFLLPLRTVLATSDVFTVAFDLRMTDIAIGTSSNKPYTFQVALGLVNSISITQTNAYRGAGQNNTYGVKNTCEFDYFPDSGHGSTFAPTVISTNNRVAFSDNHPLTLTTGDLFRVTMGYSNLVLRTTVTRNGLPYGLAPTNYLKALSLAAYPDFRLDSLAIINWSDALQAGAPQYWGSILAHGIVDNLTVTLPDPPIAHCVGGLTNGVWRTVLPGHSGWAYLLERSTNSITWSTVSTVQMGTGGPLSLQDTNPPLAGAFYRVRTFKP